MRYGTILKKENIIVLSKQLALKEKELQQHKKIQVSKYSKKSLN